MARSPLSCPLKLNAAWVARAEGCDNLTLATDRRGPRCESNAGIAHVWHDCALSEKRF